MTNKMTNVKALAYVLENCELPEEIREKCEAMKASFEKRASRKSNGPTKAQKANAEIAEQIATAMVAGECYGSAEIAGLVAALDGASPQKVTGVMKGLIANGTVVAEKVKGKASYRLA